jgi:DNA-binding CsgD family transcriptional regulator
MTTASLAPPPRPADDGVRIAVVGQSGLLTHGLRALLEPFVPTARVDVLDATLSLQAPRPVVFEPSAPMSSDDRALLRRVVDRGWLPVAYVWPGEQGRRAQVPCPAVGVSRALGAQELHAELSRLAHRMVGLVDVPPSRDAGASPGPGAGRDETLRSVGPCAVPVELSAREREMVELIALGLSNEEIARHCYVTVNTVKTFIRSAYRKIGVTRRTQAVAWALEQGLVEPSAATGLTAAAQQGDRAR